MEMSLRQSLIISEGGFTIFAMRPISGVLLACAALMILLPPLRLLLRQRVLRREAGAPLA